MGRRGCLVPDYVFAGYSSVTPQFLKNHGITLLLCDLDNTLLDKGHSVPMGGMMKWQESLAAVGIKIFIVSNNRHEKRVARFAHALHTGYIFNAGKPSRKYIQFAIQMGHVPLSQVALMGDRLLTDVLGAKRCGIMSIMVEPIRGSTGVGYRLLRLLQEPYKRQSRDYRYLS